MKSEQSKKKTRVIPPRRRGADPRAPSAPRGPRGRLRPGPTARRFLSILAGPSRGQKAIKVQRKRDVFTRIFYPRFCPYGPILTRAGRAKRAPPASSKDPGKKSFACRLDAGQLATSRLPPTRIFYPRFCRYGPSPPPPPPEPSVFWNKPGNLLPLSMPIC